MKGKAAWSLKSILSTPITRFRDVVQEGFGVPISQLTSQWYASLGLAQVEAREADRRAISSVEDWEAERRRLRADYQAGLGEFPPPQVEVLEKGQVEKGEILVRRLLFSVSPDHWVSANLFLPPKIPGPLPAIINACGHNDRGKSGYGGRCSLLALNGYVVLSFDLVGMGERRLADPDPIAYCASTQHDVIGSKMVLAGCSLGWFMVQETMAAVSVLQGLPEVDPERIGITGSSGGGWLSVHAAALDERIQVVVPAASVSSLRYQIQADDAEQTFFDMLRQGLHYPDLMGFLICPRPLFIVANTQDIWSLESTEYAHAEAARFYELRGHPDRLRMKVWDRGHGYQEDQLAEALGWFNTWLKKDPDAPVITAVRPENAVAEGELQVSPRGNIYADGYPGPGRVFWNFARENLCGPQDVEGFLTSLKQSLPVEETVAWAELDRFHFGAGIGRRICYAPEEGLLLPAEILMPDSPQGVILLVDESDRREDLDWQIQCATEGLLVLRPDLRGWGEMRPEEGWADWEGWSRNLYDGGRRNLHALALMTGRDLVLDRVQDLLALLNVAQDLAPGQEITVWGRRQGAFVALLAGLVDSRIQKMILEKYLASFRDVMARETPVHCADGYLRGLLKWGLDVPDLLAAYPGELITRDPLNGWMQPLGPGRDKGR